MRNRLAGFAIGGVVFGLLASTPAALAQGAGGGVIPEIVQRPAGELPEASAVFEKYITAIGGREKVNSIRNRVVTGYYTGEPFQFRAAVRMRWEEGGKFHQHVNEPAGLRFDLYANGDYTWIVLQDQPPAPMGGLQRLELIDTADLHGEASYQTRYKEIATVGLARAEGRPVYAVRAVTHAGRPHTLFFDQESGLLLGTRVPTMGEGGRLREMMLRLLDYKDFGGVLYPTRLEQRFPNSDAVNSFTYTSVEVNVDSEQDFTVPDSIIEEFKAALEREKQEGEANDEGSGG